MSVDKLTATKLKKLGEGKHSDGRGLYFFVRGESRLWTLRYTQNGKRNEISLGRYPDVTLAQARERREEARRAIAEGVAPKQSQTDRRVATLVAETFDAVRGDLKGGGTAGRWMSPVDTHIIPKLGSKDVTKLTAIEVRDALSPIWRTKTSAASKALDRLGITMRHAAAKYPGEVDATVVPNAKVLLGSQGHKVTHIPAMPWSDVPEFYQSLGDDVVELALRLLILTASRSAPVRFAHINQFDGDTWTVPAENMKGGAEFRIPLSAEAQRVVNTSTLLARDGFLFCARRGKPISDAAMAKYMNRCDLSYRPHGFRSSFRDWAAESGKDWTLAEVALDHRVGGKVQRSYQRSDLLEPRRALMNEWSSFLG